MSQLVLSEYASRAAREKAPHRRRSTGQLRPAVGDEGSFRRLVRGSCVLLSERWQTNTISAVAEDDQPFGLGTRVREVHRAPGGKQLASLVAVSEYEPDRVFAMRMLERALPIHARITFELTELGTRLQLDAHGQPSGPMRLAQPLISLSLKRQFTGYCPCACKLEMNRRTSGCSTSHSRDPSKNGIA
jgi:hypothetical protein